MVKKFGAIFFLLVSVFFIALSWSDISYRFVKYQVIVESRIPAVDTRLFLDNQDTAVFFVRSNWLADRQVPYASALQEYPQWALAYISVPRIFTNDYLQYRTGLVALNAVCYVALAWLLWRLLQRFGSLSSIFYLLLPSFVFFTFNRFDIFVSVVVLASLYFLVNYRFPIAFLLLAVATLTKWYPALFLPLYLVFARRSGKKISTLLWWYAGAVAVPLALTALVAGWVGVVMPYVFHFARGVELESWLNFLPGSGGLVTIFFYLQFGGVVLALLFGRFDEPKNVFLFAALSLAMFIFFNRTYSPQFIVWLLPLLLLVLERRELWLVVLYDLLNYCAYYFGYLNPLPDIWPWVLYMNFLRVILLALLIYLILRKIIKARALRLVPSYG